MRYLLTIMIVVLCLLGLMNCTIAPDKPLYRSSNSLPGYQQSSFIEYQRETVAWLEQNRVFVSDNKADEIEANSPFELKPEQKSNRGILLVHGLAGSPFYFKDVAKELVDKGFVVRVMLVPGHGSRPADLKSSTLKSWEQSVQHQIKLFKKEVDDLWLGGFSTGANLVTSLAINDPDISGLLLFSPGFKSNRKGLFLAPLASKFIDWIDIDIPVGNYTKYESLTVQAAANYYLSAQRVVKRLKQHNYDKPVLMTISEDDIVIDPIAIYELFKQNFIHPDSRLIWYGDEQSFTDNRVIYQTKNIPSMNISTFSHMNVLFSPQNSFYGKAGGFRFCSAQLTAENFTKCKSGKDTWYAEYGYSEAGRIYARLSWNPYFTQLSEQIDSTLN
ncbi:MAG: alpha/beta hydrolase [Oceanospirillaceae bacterium]